MLRRSIVFTFCLLMAAGAVCAEASIRELNARIADAEEYFDAVMDESDKAIPASLLAKAYGIVIVRQYRGGFIIGGKGGNGIAMARLEGGEWGPPVFVTNAEGSIGWQIGGQSIDSIYLVMNAEGMEILHKSKFKVGVDASAAAGPVGRDAEAKLSPNAAILAYSRSKGLYLGASIEGGALAPDRGANKKYYGDANLSTQDILYGKKVAMPDAAVPLARKLKQSEASRE